ncbi:hypothetical protein FRC19_004919 [Serendipita sp. 401]|nr:hypothetical protein FRC19_004919 [Serendipita sp. 401]
MSSLGSFLPFKLHKPRPIDFTETLPPELWGMVIDLVLDEIRNPYLYCSPKTFSQLQMRLFHTENLERDSILDDWKRARSVCRTWRRLAGPCPHFLIKETLPRKFQIREKPSSIFIGGSPKQKAIMERLIQDPSIGHKLTTLAFGLVLIHQTGAVDLLLDQSSIFPNLRCLAFADAASQQPFWRGIQDGFPKLVSLTVRRHRQSFGGLYTLDNLQLLDVEAWRGFQLSCPSLKHLCISGGSSLATEEFLHSHSHQLESFLSDSFSPSLSSCENSLQFWSAFPNLELLGMRAGLSRLQEPPAGHPLRYIQLSSFFESPRPDEVLPEIEPFRGITRLYLMPPIPGSRVGTLTVDDLRDTCLARGIEIVKLPRVKQRATSTKRFYWILDVAICLTCPCWFPFLLCFPPKGCRPM